MENTEILTYNTFYNGYYLFRLCSIFFFHKDLDTELFLMAIYVFTFHCIEPESELYFGTLL